MSGSNTSYTVGNATTKRSTLKCFTHGVTLQCLHIWFLFEHIFMIIFTMLIWLLSDIYTSVLSTTAFTYSYVFLVESFELSECDRTLISLCFLSQTLSVQIICILLKLSNVFSASLSAEDTETNIKSVLNDSSLLFEIRRNRNDHPTNLAGMETWDNSEYVACLPRAPQMRTARGTCVIALCCLYPYKCLSCLGQNPSSSFSISRKP